jgi:transposase-like protein
VLERPVRRTYPAEYKRRILEEADRCTEPGQLGALLRREGLYSSHLSVWRKQREQAVRAALTTKPRGRKAKRMDPLAEENQRLRRENQQLRQRLQQAETIIEFQKKISELLGIPPKSLSGSESEE